MKHRKQIYFSMLKTTDPFCSDIVNTRVFSAVISSSLMNLFHPPENLAAPLDRTILTSHDPLLVIKVTPSPAIHSRPSGLTLLGISYIEYIHLSEYIKYKKLYWYILNVLKVRVVPLHVSVCRHVMASISYQIEILHCQTYQRP